ncbi:MAG: hypothetical protein HKP61_02860, partial [Dactylosporangium sp.]|nr:hypothetical protein [Dactylosporangium sp.]NNJ59900.1 hypothetical protein [Dactylosporangium sp.]
MSDPVSGGRPRNERLRRARLRIPSSARKGCAMSRQELADAVNAWLYEMTGEVFAMNAAHVGKLEAGMYRLAPGARAVIPGRARRTRRTRQSRYSDRRRRVPERADSLRIRHRVEGELQRARAESAHDLASAHRIGVAGRGGLSPEDLVLGLGVGLLRLPPPLVAPV